MIKMSRRHILQTSALALLTLATCSAPAAAQKKERAEAKPAPRRVVRLVYIVSADRKEDPAYTRAIAHAASVSSGVVGTPCDPATASKQRLIACTRRRSAYSTTCVAGSE